MPAVRNEKYFGGINGRRTTKLDTDVSTARNNNNNNYHNNNKNINSENNYYYYYRDEWSYVSTPCT